MTHNISEINAIIVDDEINAGQSLNKLIHIVVLSYLKIKS
jgi:hypothetical protein